MHLASESQGNIADVAQRAGRMPLFNWGHRILPGANAAKEIGDV